MFKLKRLRFIILALALISMLYQSTALEASFTPAPDKDTGETGGPLPLSQNQRNQLLQLEQQITQSPNPQETLKKVAESNGMSVEELGNLLMRNRRDMEMAEGGGGGAVGGVSNSLPRKMIRLLSTILLVGVKSAKAHPRNATILSLLFITTLYVTISAPRTGVVLSSGRGLPSSSHTTLLQPPTKYLSKYLNRISHTSSLPKGVNPGSLFDLFLEDDDIEDHVKNLSKTEKKRLSLAAAIQRELPFGVLLPTEEELKLLHEKEISQLSTEKSKGNIMEKIEEEAWEHAIDLAFQSACRILSKRRFTEFIGSSQTKSKVRIYSEPRKTEHQKDVAVVVMKSMGDWGRYAIQPLRLTSEEDEEDGKTVQFHTLKGGAFDGELQFSVRRLDGDDKNPSSVSVSAVLLIPKKGRSIKQKKAEKMLSLLIESIATSSVTEAKQILARELQNTIYRGRAKARTTQKRHIAFENMKKMEEMADERRRKWQRSNPDSGRYTPSGRMMHGPGGGPSHSF